jgi:O-antigen/teichoic acid export membrane protein
LDEQHSSASTIVPAYPESRGLVAKFFRNAGASIIRLFISSLVGLVLPAYLTHHLPVKTYGAWVLILQLSAYVSYLDFGVQTAVAKYIAEYEAKADHEGMERSTSVGFAITLVASILGVLLTLILAWRVPYLFREMPSFLYTDVRIGLVLIGASLSFGLATSVFSAIFLGLQRYSVPMAIAAISRVLFVVVVCLAVFSHTSLVVMGTAAAIVNVLAALLPIMAWSKLAGGIHVRLSYVDRSTLKRMLEYCFILTIWSASMLCISGLDVAIVGHYDFDETAFYSIAILPTNLILSIFAAIFGPLMPATSALSTQRTATEMGNLLARTTRYSTLLLLLSGLPLLIGGAVLLRFWVGSTYALHSVRYLHILIVANILRNLLAPYATMVVATGKQRVATIAAISEGLVNIAASVYLASRMGAIGVALGTLLGAFVSVTLHFAVSMCYTYETFKISRNDLFFSGIVRPSVMAIPTLLLLPLWWSPAICSLDPRLYIVLVLSTGLLFWYGGVNRHERDRLIILLKVRTRLFVNHG